jgi:hypothetical protein
MTHRKPGVSLFSGSFLSTRLPDWSDRREAAELFPANGPSFRTPLRPQRLPRRDDR